MRRISVLHSAAIVVLVIALIAVAVSASRGWVGVAHADNSSDEVPPTDRPVGGPLVPAAPSAVPMTLVYFQPQDNDANATVIVLSNSANVTQTVVVRGYTATSGPYGVWNVPVGPYGLVHVVSDAVAASPPPSFANSIVANFTDFTSYATLEVPAGVHIDGYLVFNSGTGTVDPRVDQGAIPLRFSTDPLTVMLPTIRR